VFTRIQVTKRYLQIADQILERIRSGQLAAGSQLPSERDLAVQLGVSRPTVREALIALELLGVVDVRIGQGTYIVGDAYASLDEIVRVSALAPFDLLEARLLIESNTAAHTAQRWASGAGNEEGLNKTIAISNSMTQIVQDATKVGEFYRLGLEFHKALAQCSANEVLDDIISYLVDTARHPLWELINQKILQDQQARQFQIDEHESIIRAIREGDSQAAAKAMEHHLTHLAEFSLS
jgi:DNA-binding FadR family transcriptional regulator